MEPRRSIRPLTWYLFGSLLALVAVPAMSLPVHDYPRLLGMNNGYKGYDEVRYQAELAKLDIVILGFYKGWKTTGNINRIRQVVRDIKARNPNILVGQYTVLNEAYEETPSGSENDKAQKLNQENWWAYDNRQNPVQWTSAYNTWDINITPWSRRDTRGDRYPQWLAKRDYGLYFGPTPEFDIWFLDNVMYRPRVKADWNGDGRLDDPDDPLVQSQYRKGHRAEWKTIRSLTPSRLLVGNADNDLSYPEYRGQLDGAFLEGLMGRVWSLATVGGWDKAMERYRAAMNNTRPPHIVAFHVFGNPEDYQFARFALASCLLDDGYFSFTDKDKGFSSVPWFDEYDVHLGTPLEPAATAPWKNGVYRRLFRSGMVLVNPAWFAATVEVPAGYRRISGHQAPDINSGAQARQVTLSGRDGLILLKSD